MVRNHTYKGVSVTLHVGVAGTNRWDWSYTIQGGSNVRNGESFCKSEEEAWEEARFAAERAIDRLSASS